MGLALAVPQGTKAAASAAGKQLLELRTYRFTSNAKLEAFDQFLAQSAVPALNRAGIRPVGVFRLRQADNPKLGLEADGLDLYVLLPHNSPESFLLMIDRLAADADFTQAAEALLMAPKSDPAYARFESSLLLAFDEMPRVEVPTRAPTRLMQLRIYESHNDERALRKIHMFNEGGEIAIFRRCGLTAVFFGQALIGSKLPNLTYMVSFENEAAMNKAWATFGKDPDWQRLRTDESYLDTVSNITNLVLRPATSSQI